MYNRYIRNDNGSYTRIPQEEVPPQKHAPEPPPRQETPPPPPPKQDPPREEPRRPPPPPSPPQAAGRIADGLTGFLRHVLDQLHLDHVDTGDLLLLVRLFFLFREDADEELLVALGLLLIL